MAVESYAFGPFRLTPATRLLTRDGAPITLSARAFDVLHLLARREGAMATRDDIIREVWRGVTVEENNLTVQISALRRALGELPGGASAIVTVPNQGYRLALPVTRQSEPAAVPPPPDAAPTRQRHAARGWWVAVASLVLLLGAGAVLFRTRTSSPLPPAPQAAFVPPRLSLAILPLRNLAQDHRDDALADAVSDDLTTEMAHMPAATVIARETADSYKGRAVPTPQIAQALNVRYVLEGSLRPLGGKLAVNAQLIEAQSGLHVWAERFEVAAAPADQAQQAIVYRIASALRTALIDDEAKRSLRERPTTPDATDLYVRARALWDRQESLPSMASAIPLLEQAIRLQPDYVPALAELGSELARDLKGEGPAGMAGRVAEGHRVIDHALGLARNDPDVLSAQGFLLMNDGKMDAAEASFQAALAIDPANRRALSGGYLAAKCLAQWQLAYDRVLRVEQADPEGPGSAYRKEVLGELSLLLGRPAEAVTQIQSGVSAWPAPGPGVPPWDALGSDRLFLAAALVLSGNAAKAHSMLQADETTFPHRSLFRFGEYMTRTAQHDPAMVRVFAALRQAGLPDYTSEYENDGVAAPATPQPHGDLDATPMAVPGTPTIDTPALLKLRQANPPPVLIDMGAGVARPQGALEGSFDPLSADGTRAWLRENAALVPPGRLVVVFGDSAFGWRAYNGILQLREAGLHGLMWYRGGEEAWARAGQPAIDTRTD